ncbi:MAG: hypothetical protein II501_01505 [Clostridia bacterium]|nr:hypothetical protein [Clostridia bacterium]
MKKLAKKFMTAAVALSMTATMFAATASASDVTVGSNYVENEFIHLYCGSDYSRYGLKTTGGNPDNPNDDSKNLLYPTTSRMFVSIDGRVFTLGSDSAPVPDEAGKKITASKDYNGLTVERILTIVPNGNTNREDTVEFKMVVTNNTTENHEVGARIMLDTMLGSNDHAPFRMPNLGAVTMRTQLEGNDIPEMYQAFDNLSEPTVVSTGTFARGADKPDIVQFNRWGSSTNNTLIPSCDSTLEIGDSAVNSIWNEKTLAPGKSIAYKTYYGLGEFVASGNTELVVGATKATPNFVINEEGTGYEPVSLIGYVQNAGSTGLDNVNMNISLPTGVSLVDGDATVNVGSLNAGDTNQVAWKFNAVPANVERVITVKVSGWVGENTETAQEVTYQYVIPAIEGAPEVPTEEPTEEPTEAPTAAPTEPETEAPTSATNPTVPATAAPTAAPTSAPTNAATNAPANNNSSNTTNSNTSSATGKVDTGDSQSAVMILAMVIAAATVVFVVRKRAK